MADKMRTTFPIAVSFAEGEAPTGTKLNAIGSQAKSGLAILERAIGDMWNQSGDSITSDYPLYLTNLARTLGAQDLMSGKMPTPDMTGTTSIDITQSIIPFRNMTEILLDFAPTAVSDATLATSMTANGFTTRVATRDLIDSSLEWAVDITNGKIYLGAPLSNSASTIQYGVSTFPGDASNESAFNLIPNQIQDSWAGLKICQISANKYWIVLPFRRPIESDDIPTKSPVSTGNTASIAAPSVKRYWGPVSAGYAYTAGVSDSRLYRYSLPQIVQDMFDSPVAGQVIPAGLLHLFDTDNKTIIEGLTFRIPESPITFVGSQVPWVIQVEGSTLDATFAAEVSSAASEAHADYHQDFAILCAGQSIADMVGNLRDELTFGSRSVGMQKRVAHSDLTGNNPAQGTRFPIAPPPSFLDGDDHSQYLSRRGSTSTLAARRDVYNNGMLGDLLMSAVDPAGGYQNENGFSNKIWFNAVTSGVNLFADSIGLISNAGFFANGNIETTDDLIAGTDLSVAGLSTLNDLTVTGSVTTDLTVNADVFADDYNRNAARILSLAVPPVPVWLDGAHDSEWIQLSNATGGSGQRFVYNGTGASTEEVAFVFQIPYVPPHVTFTSITLLCSKVNLIDGTNSYLRASIGTALLDAGATIDAATTVESSALDPVDFGDVTITLPLTASHSVGASTGERYVVLGFRHAGGAAFEITLDIRVIRLTYTQDKL